MGVKKVYVNDKNEAHLVCEHCGRSKTVHVTGSQFEAHRPFKIKCRCDATFEVVFEKRRFYRKNLHLEGSYRLERGAGGSHPMIVLDLSQGGMSFDAGFHHPLSEGDLISTTFLLGSYGKPRIEAEARVLNIRNTVVGVEFVNLSDYHRKQIGFFLMP